MSGPIIVLVLVLLMLPGMARADFQLETIGQNDPLTSLLRPPPRALLGREPETIMFTGPHDATRLGFSLDYSSAGAMFDPLPAYPPLLYQNQETRFSASAVGGLALGDRVGLFGRVGLSYDLLQAASQSDGPGYDLQLARRYGVGVNVRASEVLSLHFEWERHAPGGIGAGVDLTRADWDPWKEKNVFGAGVHYGF